MTRTLPDLRASFEESWPGVRSNLYDSQLHIAHLLTRPMHGADIERIRQKGERGHLEHGGTIEQFTPEMYLLNIVEELDDALYYCAHWTRHHGSPSLLYQV